MRLSLKVIPNASRTEIVGWLENELKVKVKAVPEGGRANKEICQFLAKEFNLTKHQVKIVAGEKSRNKIVELQAEESNILAKLPPQA